MDSGSANLVLYSRFPVLEDEPEWFWKSFTSYELKRTVENYLRLLTLALEFVQLISFPFWATVDWKWSSIFRDFISIASGTIEAEWFFWVVVVLVIVWLFYNILLYFEADTYFETSRIGRAIIAPCSLFLLLYSSAGLIPSCITLLNVLNCRVVQDQAFNTTHIALSDISLAQTGTTLPGSVEFIKTGLFVIPYNCLECFTGTHWAMLSIGFVLALVYIPLSLYTCYMFQEFYSRQQLQIRFNPKFTVVVTTLKILMAVGRVFFFNSPVLYLVVMIIMYTVAAYISLSYQPCTFIPINYWGCIGFITGALGSFATLILVIIDYDNADIATFVIIIMIVVTLIVLCVLFHQICPIVLESQIGSRDGKEILKSMMFATKERKLSVAQTDGKKSTDSQQWFHKMFLQYSELDDETEKGKENLSNEATEGEEIESKLIFRNNTGLHKRQQSSRRISIASGAYRLPSGTSRDSVGSIGTQASYVDREMGQIGRRITGVTVDRKKVANQATLVGKAIETEQKAKHNIIATREISRALKEALKVVKMKLQELRADLRAEKASSDDDTIPQDTLVILEFYTRLDIFLNSLIKSKSPMLIAQYYVVELEVSSTGIPESEQLEDSFKEGNRRRRNVNSTFHFESEPNDSNLVLIRNRFKTVVLQLCEHCVTPQMQASRLIKRQIMSREPSLMSTDKSSLESVYESASSGDEANDELENEMAQLSLMSIRTMENRRASVSKTANDGMPLTCASVEEEDVAIASGIENTSTHDSGLILEKQCTTASDFQEEDLEVLTLGTVPDHTAGTT